MADEPRPQFSREQLIKRLREIAERGYVLSGRPGNDGAVGNTLEDLLGIPENNFRLADYGRFEVKAQRATTGSLLTLFHCDPEPRRPNSIVQQVLVARMGWPHDRTRTRAATSRISDNEQSFRATLSNGFSVRGLRVVIDRPRGWILIEFDPDAVVPSLSSWRDAVLTGLTSPFHENPPHWPFERLEKSAAKLNSLLYALASAQIVAGQEWFYYQRAWLLEGFIFERFLQGIEQGVVHDRF